MGWKLTLDMMVSNPWMQMMAEADQKQMQHGLSTWKLRANPLFKQDVMDIMVVPSSTPPEATLCHNNSGADLVRQCLQDTLAQGVGTSLFWSNVLLPCALTKQV